MLFGSVFLRFFKADVKSVSSFFKDKKCIYMKLKERYKEKYKEPYNEKIQLMEERWATDMNL